MNENINKIAKADSLTSSELWDALEEVKEALGTEEVLDALCKAMGNDELESNLSYIIRCYDLADPEEEEEEEL